ncbi:MAG: HD-GYP domain-containing protein [Firmicutes bacterium]|nr:HD-GYP domain-containing protein [Bacillota bacterium]
MAGGCRLLSWSDLGIWTGFLLISAYATGTLYEHRERTIAELRETYYGLLQILSQFIFKDKYTQSHSYRVSFYATQIARQMGLSSERIEGIRAAALLHDIGKLELSREVLYKAARLTEAELAELRTHVDKGVQMLSPVGGTLKRVLPIVLAHHETYDGNGYHKWKGEEIPLEARILSVADVYDALTSDRPYRRGMSPFETRDDIVKRAGKDFDPRVVRAFESAFRSGPLEVPEALVYAS